MNSVRAPVYACAPAKASLWQSLRRQLALACLCARHGPSPPLPESLPFPDATPARPPALCASSWLQAPPARRQHTHQPALALTGLSFTHTNQPTRPCPDPSGSVGWASSSKAKCRRFGSRSGHMPGCRFGPLSGYLREATRSGLLSHIDVPFPLFLRPFPSS
ncbi:hypothetical protein HJG60_010420 [Phyllostomus discolor]|uniref:Uncharacterized protein n=1 Tax=Phyllostomus discolor TaxID=89673 RepID=A0A834EKD2_9CHIR|nr:hypothetical protein HJG60_010420 [Phyllostomus discolor]